MSKLLFALLILGNVAVGAETNTPRRLVCVGRVEPVDGEVEVSAQVSGTLTTVGVKEGDWVTAGTILAELEASREKAALDLAIAKLVRVKAGNGKEEIAAAEAARDGVAAELEFAETEYQRAIKLREQQVVADEAFDERQQRVSTLRKQLARATKQAEALKRGPLPEEITVAEAEESFARASYDLRLVRAQTDGAILQLYRHTGDFVTMYQPTPILRMADTKRLRARIEVNEQDARRAKEGLEGEFTVIGVKEVSGRLIMRKILPSFAPRRLFEPDSTVRMDTRTLNVLCDLQNIKLPVHSGQRITAVFTINAQ
jgi:multidrug resistance efflux pump